MSEKCYVLDVFEDGVWSEAEFMGVFQYSQVIDPSPMVGGHPGGVIAYPRAIVKAGGVLTNVDLADVKFDKNRRQ